MKKRLKNLWNRFRHWLIYKLGGYVERTHVVTHHTVIPVTLDRVLVNIELDRYRNSPTYKEYIDRHLIGKLSDYLYDNREQFVDICESVPRFTDPLTTIDLRASVKVLPKLPEYYTS